MFRLRIRWNSVVILVCLLLLTVAEPRAFAHDKHESQTLPISVRPSDCYTSIIPVRAQSQRAGDPSVVTQVELRTCGRGNGTSAASMATTNSQCSGVWTAYNLAHWVIYEWRATQYYSFTGSTVTLTGWTGAPYTAFGWTFDHSNYTFVGSGTAHAISAATGFFYNGGQRDAPSIKFDINGAGTCTVTGSTANW